MSKQQWITENLKSGEEYAGLILGKDGPKDYHLILLPGQASDVTWSDATKWAQTIGGELPTRREQSLLFANLKDQFERGWHWSGETYTSCASYAWGQYFDDGCQDGGHKNGECHARAVRRSSL